MPRNANHGISALQVFIALVDAYSTGNRGITLNELKRILIKELQEYFTDGRSRSARRALKILSEYSLYDEDKNKFGEPVYFLNGELDSSVFIFHCTLAFLDDMTKGRTGEKRVLERLEAIMPAIIEVLRTKGCFARVPKEKGNIIQLIFESLAHEQGISLYTSTKFFYSQPQFSRVVNMFAWLSMASKQYGDQKSSEVMLITFYEACKSVIPENLNLPDVNEQKTQYFMQSSSFKDILKLNSIKSKFDTSTLPEKVREKIAALQE